MNCWYTMATFRLRTGIPTTLTPSTATVPADGTSSPAMIRIRLVLPACVAPSNMVTAPLRGVMLMS